MYSTPHQAREVLVTGSFDGWSKSVQLERTDAGFEKEVLLPDDRILYKVCLSSLLFFSSLVAGAGAGLDWDHIYAGTSLYLPSTVFVRVARFIVDGSWLTDPAASQQETDHHNNTNSVLLPAQLSPTPTTTTTTSMSGVTPESTTAGLAAAVAKEPSAHEATISSAAPESTTAQLAKDVPLEKKMQTPGTFPETPLDEQEVSVNPLPATGTVGNPVKLAPGEQVPESSTVTDHTLGSNVTTDKAGYEKDASDPAMAAMAAGEQPVSVSPLPATGTVGNPIKLAPGEQVPESSTVTDNTLGSNVTTDKESYEKDASDPAMAAMAAQQHQHDQKNTYSALPIDTEPKSKPTGPNDNPTIQSVAPQSTTAALAGAVPLEKTRNAADTQYDPEVPAKQVPDLVKDSMNEAHSRPEAAGVPEMVKEKKELEQELLHEIPRSTESGLPAPTTSAAVASSMPAPTTTEPIKQDQQKQTHQPETRDLSPKSREPDVPGVGSEPIAGGTAASQVSSAPKETAPQVTTGPTTTTIPKTSGVPERKAVEPKTTSTAAPAGASAQNGTTANNTTETMDRKKKHRISGFFNKLKEKFA
ncbi:extensin [Arthroderma uncinatum]|uniref:extensin n=1 Tax=Arthroderma uncinatum TaxID=74035 RepID=UPI00144A6DFF|nr:extensin [Arthroderma uncinatum]KAF3490983.1 extensin [Arthroderma uncinatum]